MDLEERSVKFKLGLLMKLELVFRVKQRLLCSEVRWEGAGQASGIRPVWERRSTRSFQGQAVWFGRGGSGVERGQGFLRWKCCGDQLG